MFNFNIISHASRFWFCSIVSLRRGMRQNSRFSSHRFLSSAGKAEKQPSETENIINAEIAVMKECKTPPEVSNHKCYSYIKNSYLLIKAFFISSALLFSFHKFYYALNYKIFSLLIINPYLGSEGTGKAQTADCSSISLES